MDNLTEDEKATKFYQKHLERMRTYSKNHREKARETSKKAYQAIKDDPEKYKLYLERRRTEYKNRKEKKKAMQTTENNIDEIEVKDLSQDSI
jgi:hypothetical protein